MAGDYTFGSSMGSSDDPVSDNLGDLLTYGAQPAEETVGQPNGAPNVKSDASAPNAPATHVAAVVSPQPAAQPTQASQAPAYTAPDQDELQALQAQKVTDLAPQKVNPKWWERLAGGAGAGLLALGKVPGAVEAGESVTNRGQIAADATQQGKVAQDNAAIQAWQDGQRQNQQDFQNQSEAYRTKQEGVRTDQAATDATNRQADSDRTFNAGRSDAAFNQGRDNKNDSWEQGFRTNGQNETIRHDKADEANSRANTGIAGARERREAQKQTNDEKLTSPEVQQEKAANSTEDKYRSQVQQIEDGDPKGATPEAVKGFKATYREVQNSATNPDTEKPWKNEQEKTDYLDGLKQANADRKNSVMTSYAADMNRLGRPTPTVTYDKEGRTSTQPSQASPQSPPTTTKNVTPTQNQVTIQKPPTPGAKLTDKAIARQYFDAAGGDKVKARAAAEKDGWKF